MIHSVTIISNTMSMNHMPKDGEEAQQVLTIQNNGQVFFKGYVFEHKMVLSREMETQVEDAKSLIAILAGAFQGLPPVSMNINQDSWEVLMNTDEGYRWYNGSLGDTMTIGSQDASEYLRERIPVEGLILFGGEDTCR